MINFVAYLAESKNKLHDLKLGTPDARVQTNFWPNF